MVRALRLRRRARGRSGGWRTGGRSWRRRSPICASSLRALGGDLFVRRGDLVERGAAGRPRGRRRQDRRRARTPAHTRRGAGGASSARVPRERIELRVEDTIAAVALGELATADRDHYRVFTPYWRRWRETPLAAAAEPPPPEWRSPPGLDSGGPGSAANSHPCRPGCEAASPRPGVGWPAGSATASTTTSATRDLLAVDGTSRLSPYLHLGCVSARESGRAREILRRPSREEFVRQLCWRDFFLQLLSANPETATEDMRPGRVAWRDDAHALAPWARRTDGSADRGCGDAPAPAGGLDAQSRSARRWGRF